MSVQHYQLWGRPLGDTPKYIGLCAIGPMPEGEFPHVASRCKNPRELQVVFHQRLPHLVLGCLNFYLLPESHQVHVGFDPDQMAWAVECPTLVKGAPLALYEDGPPIWTFIVDLVPPIRKE